MFSNLNIDSHDQKISRLNEIFSASELEELNTYFNDDKKFDKIRKLLMERLENAQKRIKQEWSLVDHTKKSELLFDIQEILYEMQLVEHAAKTPILHVVKLLFAANPSRCIFREASPGF
jgi:hypothetical protein